MGPSDGRFHTSASVSHNPRFAYDNSLDNHNPNTNYHQNDELNWGLFNFNNGIESYNQSFMNPNQFLDSPNFFPFNSNMISTPTIGNGNYSDFDFKEEKTSVSGLNFQSQTRSPISSSISGNQMMEESMKSQVLDWNVKSQPKHFDFSMEVSKVEPESVESPPAHCSFDPIQATKEEGRYEDGYNWRKYGQKLVKGTNKHRSYFKCSHPNCPTKKKVEKDLNGYITEIIYKGKHNHPMPQNKKKALLNSVQHATFDHVFKPFSERSLVSFREDEYEHGSSICKSGNDHETEPDAKRLKVDEDEGEGESETMSHDGSKTVHEPRVVIEMKSDVDILDDGYKWRKYGQKVVKGNPNPRSYYKCTYVGCPVRKLVERASHDSQSVITTYEAKHNHNLPMPNGGGGVYAINQLPKSNTTTTLEKRTNYGFLDSYRSNQH